MKVISIGKTTTDVRITHCRKSLIYFAKNTLGWKLLPIQEEFIKWAETKTTNK